jgi:hypothetical protein
MDAYRQKKREKLERASFRKKKREEEEKRQESKCQRLSRSPRLTQVQLDEAKSQLQVQWSSLRSAGKLKSDISLESSSPHGCLAEAKLADGSLVKSKFNSDDCHAEMNLLEEVWCEVQTLNTIESIEIEKQPCPRCAVVLRKLNLADLVKYKKTGQKDYPTWRYPDIPTVNWAVAMGINDVKLRDGRKVHDQRDIDELLDYFRTHKWWQ